MLLAGCGGSGGTTADAGAPVIRGDVAATSSLTVSGTSATAVAGNTITLTSAGGTGTDAVSYATTGTECHVTGTSLTATAAGICTVTATKGTQTATAAFTYTAATVSAPGTPPAPTVVAGSAKVTATVAAGTPGGTPDWYMVTAYTANGTAAGTCTVTGASGSCDVTALTGGNTYTVKATASNTADTSGASAASAAVTLTGTSATTTVTSKAATVTFITRDGKGWMPAQTSSTPVALNANGFRRCCVGKVFIGWSAVINENGNNSGNFDYADKAVYSFDSDITLEGMWKYAGDAVDLAATMTGPSSVSLSFGAAPNGDGTPAVASFYKIELIYLNGALVETRVVNAPGTYSFTVEPGRNYRFFVSTDRPVSPGDVTFEAPAVSTDLKSVTFDPNGGVGSIASQSATGATLLTANNGAIKRTGFAFNGWNTSANGNGTAYADQASYPFTASATLYATWGCRPLSVTASAKRVGANRTEVTFSAPQNESLWTSLAAFAAKDGGKGATMVPTSLTGGTITINGLDKNSGYTFDVTATNAAGCSYKATANRVVKW
jgi:hypothetical protein